MSTHTHTLCQHTLCHTHTLSTNTLSHTHFINTHTLSHTHTHTLCHTQHFVHKHFVTHTLYQHTLCHTQTHTQHTIHFTHTHNRHTHTTLTHTHNTLSHTHTNTHNTQQHTHTTTQTTQQLCHTHKLNKRHLVTFTHTHNNTHTHNTHTQHTHTQTHFDIRGRHLVTSTLFHVAGVAQNSHPPSFCVAGVALMVLGGAHTLRGRRGTNSHPPSFCVAGVAQTHIHRRFAWQAWHLALGGALGGFGACDAAALCVAGVAQPDIHLRFTWQAWHKLTSTFVLRGRRGTHGTGWRAWTGLGACDAAALCVAGVAQPDIHLRFTWQAWHKLTSTVVLRGRRGTHGTGWRAWTGLGACDAAALCVAGVAQPDIHLRFTWQAWHKLTSTVVLRGRRGTDGTGWRAWAWIWAPVTPRHFAWQAWHNLTSTFVSRGRRGTNSHPPSFCVAGVALMALGGALGLAWAPVTPRHFAWQAWHNLTSTFVSRGRRGTNSHLPSFCVAGVALMALGGALGLAWAPVTPRHFAWQAWHKLTSTFVSRGRRGTNSHLPSFCVAGVAQMALGGALGLAWAPVTPRHFAWQAWHKLTSTCRFTWQAWHKLTSTVVLRGRRGTHGTGWRAWTGLGACDAAALCVAGVAQPHIHCRLRGRRGTNSHPPSFCVAGVAQMALGGALGLAWAP